MSNAQLFVSKDKKYHKVVCKEGIKELPNDDVTQYFSQMLELCKRSNDEACLDTAKFYPDVEKLIVNIDLSLPISKDEKEKSRNQLYDIASRKMATYLITLNPRAAKLVGRDEYNQVADLPYNQDNIVVGLSMYYGNQKFIGYAAMNQQNQVYEWFEKMIKQPRLIFMSTAARLKELAAKSHLSQVDKI